MRHSDMINSIVETERRARDITAQAQAQRELLDRQWRKRRRKCVSAFISRPSSELLRPNEKRRSSRSAPCRSWKNGFAPLWTIWSEKAKSTTAFGLKLCLTGL